MKVLAFDTATSSCSVAVIDNNVILAKKNQRIERGHAEILIPLIESALYDSKLEYQDLDLLAVTIGPGSFTGIRVGLATARNLALAADKPLVGFSNFYALVNEITGPEYESKSILVILESNRADFYVSIYDSNLACIYEPQAIEGHDLLSILPNGPLIVIGDAAERARDFIKPRGEKIKFSEKIIFVDTAALAKLAIKEYKNTWDTESPRPLYLMPPSARPQKSK